MFMSAFRKLMFVAVLVLPSVSSAYFLGVEITPKNPTADDSISVTVYSSFSDGCWYPQSSMIEIDSNEIRVYFEIGDTWVDSTSICIQNAPTYSYTYSIPPLHEGDYTLTAIENRNSFRDPTSDTVTQLLSILPVSNRCRGFVGNVDCDENETVDIADLTELIDHLFINFAPLGCRIEANIDADPFGNVDIADLTALIDHLFINFEPLPSCSPYGLYDYTAYNQLMTPVVSGIISLDVGFFGFLKGYYDLELLMDGARVGPQVGSDSLIGEVLGDSISISLNPQFIDANVFLYGNRDAFGFSGIWAFSGFPGVISQGPFVLRKR